MPSLWPLSKKLTRHSSHEDVSKNVIVTRDLSFIMLPWGTVQIYFSIFCKLNVDSRDQWGRTALSCAAEYGSLAVAKILLEQGANINALDYEDNSPLTWLIHAGNPGENSLAATKAYLIEKGAKEVKLGGIKLAWIWVLTYSRLLRYIRPRV